jgi:hypothetical protein
LDVDGGTIRKFPQELALWMLTPDNELAREELLDLRAALVQEVE